METNADNALAAVAASNEILGTEIELTTSGIDTMEQNLNRLDEATAVADQAGLSDEMKEKIEDARQKTLDALSKVKDTIDGLTEYRGQLQQWMDEQLMLENQMVEAVEKTRRMRMRIMAEQERIAALKEELEVMEPEEDGDGRQV